MLNSRNQCFFATILLESMGRIVKRTRVKVCGITRPEDARVAAAAGVDAIGLVFYAKSPRFVGLSDAAVISAEVGPFVTTVGLFVNAPQQQVAGTLERVGLQLLQFHGDEDDEYCRQFGRPFIKAIRMAPDLNLSKELARFPSASGFLFDAWHKDKYGGTGETFAWRRLPSGSDFPLILAGGLNPGNVADAISQARPYAVDVSGGVETAPGIKSARLIEQFIARASAG